LQLGQVTLAGESQRAPVDPRRVRK